MTREQEFKQVKEIVKTKKEDYCCGLFFSRNVVGDYMRRIYSGDCFTIDVCDSYLYFEIFGLTSEEEDILTKIYND